MERTKDRRDARFDHQLFSGDVGDAAPTDKSGGWMATSLGLLGAAALALRRSPKVV